jgi:hypothetical protein
MPLAQLIGVALLSGCSGEEYIPLKQVDSVPEQPQEKETRKEFTRKGASSRIKGDPSGINRNR